MATYTVRPLPDGVSQAYGWQVEKNGRRKSKHYKKSAAMKAARRMAGPNDTVRKTRMDGTYI